MNIIELHIEGGILFMGILSILLIGVLATGIMSFIKKDNYWLSVCQEVGLFALVWGIFGQVLGLFDAFQAIEMIGEVSQALLAGGLKISSYTTIYGFLIFLISKLIKLASFYFLKK